MYRCSTCKGHFGHESFHKDKSKPSGVSSRCKPCVKAYRAGYYAEHAEKAKADMSAYVKANREAWKATGARWREANRGKHLAQRSRRFKQRYSEDPAFALSACVRAMLKRTLVATAKPKDFVTFQKIGYTAQELMQRLEMNFQPGMTWENFGEWEIDHRVPLSVMIARGETRPEALNCLSNLKPLWREQNRSKGARYAS